MEFKTTAFKYSDCFEGCVLIVVRFKTPFNVLNVSCSVAHLALGDVIS